MNIRKIKKGDYGYIHSQKIIRTLITCITLSIPVAAFFIGRYINGTEKSLITVIAILGCLPGCKFATTMIMMFLQKPMKKEEYLSIQEHLRDLTGGYELVISAYEKQTFIDSLVVVGNTIAAYSSREKTDARFAEKHIQQILRDHGFYMNVKIFQDLKHYLDRLDSLNANRESLEKDIKWQPREANPHISRSEYILQIIYAISL